MAAATFVLAEGAQAGPSGVRNAPRATPRDDWSMPSGNSATLPGGRYFKANAATDGRLAPGLSVRSQLTFQLPPGPDESLRDAEPESAVSPTDQGLYANQLYLDYERGRIGLRAGKFAQKFGIAWDRAPGIWGADFARDYELARQVGVAGDFRFGGGDAGRHTFTVGTFFVDTTALSEAGLTESSRVRHSDGGPGNTEDFSSFSVALEGDGFKALPRLGYHVAFTVRGTDTAGQTQEKGYAGALTRAFALGTVAVRPLLEWVGFTDRNGTPGTDVTYLTTGASFNWRRWNLALSRTARDTETTNSGNTDDTLAQVSAGYALDDSLNLSLGYRYAEESGIETDIYGAQLNYRVTF